MNINIDTLLAQEIVNTVKDLCGYDINFIDCNGKIFASTNEKRIGSFHEIGQKTAATKKIIEVEAGNSFEGTQEGVNLPIFYNRSVVAVIGISGDPKKVGKYAHLAERITNLLIREKELNAFSRTEKEKKNHIIHSLINGEVLNQDYLAENLSKWGIDSKTPKRLLILQINSRYNEANLSMLEPDILYMFQMAGIKMYSFYYPNEFWAVVDEESYRHMSHVWKNFAENHRNIVKIAVGKAVSMFLLKDSYASSRTALKSLLRSQTNYASFDALTLEIILSEVGEQSRISYLRKTLDGLSAEDAELLTVYFEEEMGLSKTGERLYLHKNTLQYQLDRIYRKSGYNPRKFTDAVLLYLGLHLKEGEQQL